MKKLIVSLIIVFVMLVGANALASTKETVNTNNSSNTESVIDAQSYETNSNKTKVINESTLYVLPLLNSTKLEQLKKNDEVTVISVNGSWAYVYSESNSGWVFANNLESIQTKTAQVKSSEEQGYNIKNNQVDVNSAIDSNKRENTIANENVATNTETKNANDNSQKTQDTNILDESESKTNTTNETITKDANNSNVSNTTNSSKNEDKSNITYPVVMYVNVNAAYVRSSASATSSKVTSVGINCPVRVLSKEGDWYKVEVGAGKGYMLGSLLSLNKK